MVDNLKILQRAIAKNMVHDTSKLIKFLNQYDVVDKNASYADLLVTIDVLGNDKDFVRDYINFLIKTGYLNDYNNADGEDKKDKKGFLSNISSGFLGGLTGLTSTIIGSVSAKKERELKEKQLAQQNTQQLMQMIAAEDNKRLQKEKQENQIIMISIAALVLITGTIIFIKKT